MFAHYFLTQIAPNVDNGAAKKEPVRKYHAVRACMINKGWLSTTQIAAELHMSKEGVTALLNRSYIEEGFVEKRKNPGSDKRNVPFQWRWINESEDIQTRDA